MTRPPPRCTLVHDETVFRPFGLSLSEAEAEDELYRFGLGQNGASDESDETAETDGEIEPTTAPKGRAKGAVSALQEQKLSNICRTYCISKQTLM